MKITYNGELLDISTPNLEALILQQAGTDQGVAVALDGAVVPRSRWASTEVPEGARVDALTAERAGYTP